MNTNKNNAVLAMCLCAMWLACSCAGLYRATISLTAIVDDAAKQYAHAYNQGLVPPDVAVKVGAAHLTYRHAAGVAHDALVAYKLSGDAKDFNAALDAAKIAADSFVSALIPVIAPDKAAQLKTQIKSAAKP